MRWQALVGAPCWALALAGVAGGLALIAWGGLRAMRAAGLERCPPSPIELRRLLMASEAGRLRRSARRICCASAAVLVVAALLAMASSRLFATAIRPP